MFGESRSESPRLPSPWQHAVATSQVILTPAPSSPAEPFGRRASSSSKLGSLRTPSALSLSSKFVDDDDKELELNAPGPSTPHGGDLSRSSGSISTISAGSFTSDPNMRERLWSAGVSENLIMSPGKDVDGERVKLAAERDKAGHIEYKYKLMAATPDRFEKLTTQLKWRLTQGGGEAMYEIGVLDDGTLVGITPPEMEISLRTLELMAAELGATVMVLRTITLTSPPPVPPHLIPPDSPVDETSAKDKAKKARKARKAQQFLGRDPQDIAREKAEKAEMKAMKRARTKERKGIVDSPRGGEEMNAKTKKWWSGKLNWQLQDDGQSSHGTGESKTEMPAKNAAEEEDETGKFGLSVDEGTIQAASWQQRNLERAHQEWSRRDDAGLTDSGMEGSWEGRKGKRRKPWREKEDEAADSESDTEDSSTAEGSGSGHGAPQTDDEADIFPIDTLDLEPDEEPSQPLTADAVSKLGDERDGTSSVLEAYLGGQPSVATDGEATTKPALKQKTKKRTTRGNRQHRTERRRLDLLRGDGINAEGEFLFPEPEDTIMLAGMGSSPEGDGDSGVRGLVERLMGVPIPETHVGEARQNGTGNGGLAPDTLVSTSPTITVKPSSPGAASIFALQTALDAGTDPIPSPTDTITMPFDTLSLSFSKTQTVAGAGVVSSEDEGDPTSPDFEGGAQALPVVGSANGREEAVTRLCVEAIVVKKMEAEERFSFFDFGALGESSS